MLFLRLKKSCEWAVALVVLAACVPLYGQTGGLVGKCTDEKGNPYVGHPILLERQEVKSTYKTKTNKKGEYIYIGLALGTYKVSLMSPTGQLIYSMTKQVPFGEPTVLDFDMAKEKAYQEAHREETLKANPELAKKAEEEAKAAKEYTSLKTIFDQGVVLYDSKQYAEAAAMFERAVPLAKEKNLAAVLARLADSYGKANNLEKALEYYPKAMEANPTDATLHNNLGDLYARQGKIAEAQAEFQKSAEVDPAGAGRAYFNLGAVLYNLGKMDEAAAALKKATEADPNYADAYYWQGLALMGKATMTPDGKVVAPPGTAEALAAYLKLDPSGKNAAAAQSMLQTIQGTIDTQYKAVPKPKKK